MRNSLRKIKNVKLIFAFVMALFMIAMLAFNTLLVRADSEKQHYQNSETLFEAYLFDEYDYLTDDEEAEVLDAMMEFTQYGNAVLIITEENTSSDPDDYGKVKYEELFGKDSDGTVLTVDNDTPQILLNNYGEISMSMGASDKTSNDILSENIDYINEHGDYEAFCEKTFEMLTEQLDKYYGERSYEALDEDELEEYEEEKQASKSSSSSNVNADQKSKMNSATGYEARIIDDADLLSETEENTLLEEDMYPLTEYGNVVFVSTNYNPSGSQTEYSKDKYLSLYGSNSVDGTIFLIDMDTRQICITSAGDVRHTITAAKSNSITDNVYTYASAKNYYKCAAETYRQELTLLEGGKIAEPMRLASNISLSVIIGLLLSYALVKAFSTVGKPSEKELLAAIQTRQNLLDYHKSFTHQTRRYDPPSSSSSGGGGGGGGFSLPFL